ncbi:hypothetical protein DPV78_012707 [Talaromyces pinophilus]|nr:hypothetical protein DPV78_012707 [Talaromyces pinophilus]
MDIISIYAITAGSVFVALFLISILLYLYQLVKSLEVYISYYLIFLFFLRRYCFVGPWTCGAVLIYFLYTGVNLFCLYFSVSLLTELADRLGTLAMVNIVTSYMVGHVSFYLDILSISHHTCLQIYQATAWIRGFLLAQTSNLFTLIWDSQSLYYYTFTIISLKCSFKPIRSLHIFFYIQYSNAFGDLVIMGISISIHGHLVVLQCLGGARYSNSALAWVFSRIIKACPCGSIGIYFISVVLMASSFSIAATIPYLKKLVYSYNTLASRIRRLHLVWEVETLDIAIVVQATLNSLLKDNVLKKYYILTISIYIKSGQIIGNVMKFGNYNQAVIYNSYADYNQILQAEISRELIKRLLNANKEKEELVVMGKCRLRELIYVY